MLQRIVKIINKTRETVPLVHNITNYVTVNDVANCILAVGASPIMADDAEEVEDIVNNASALVINIGTLNTRTIPPMIMAGKAANKKGIPVVLDPVGAGISKLRNETIINLLNNVNFDIICGNISEMSFIAGMGAANRGTDSASIDETKDPVLIAKEVAKKYNCVGAVTGKIDAITDGNYTYRVKNGNAMLSSVTGTGCMVTALAGTYSAVGDSLAAAVCAISAMCIAGDIAHKISKDLGTSSFRTAIIDTLSLLDEKMFIERMDIYEED